jgi:DNA-binding MarR family transcriptional regulator
MYKFYGRVMKLSSVNIDRSSVSILNRIRVVGPQRIAELADFLNLDRSTVTRQSAVAVENGLLEKVVDENDARANNLKLTDRGRQCVDEVRRAWLAVVDELVQTLSQDERNALACNLPRLALAMDPTFEVKDQSVSRLASRVAT